MHGRTDGRTDGRENSIPPTNKVCGGYNKYITLKWNKQQIKLHKTLMPVFGVCHYKAIKIITSMSYNNICFRVLSRTCGQSLNYWDIKWSIILPNQSHLSICIFVIILEKENHLLAFNNTRLISLFGIILRVKISFLYPKEYVFSL